MYILSADALIEEALSAHRIGEVIVGLRLTRRYALKRNPCFLSASTDVCLPAVLFHKVPEKQDKMESELLASFTSPSGLHIHTVSCAVVPVRLTCLIRAVSFEMGSLLQALNLKRRVEPVR